MANKISRTQSKSQEYIAVERLIIGEVIKRGWVNKKGKINQIKLARETKLNPSTINRFIKHGVILETENLLIILKELNLLDQIVLKTPKEGTKSPPGSTFCHEALSCYRSFIEEMIYLFDKSAKEGTPLMGLIKKLLKYVEGERDRLEEIEKQEKIKKNQRDNAKESDLY